MCRKFKIQSVFGFRKCGRHACVHFETQTNGTTLHATLHDETTSLAMALEPTLALLSRAVVSVAHCRAGIGGTVRH